MLMGHMIARLYVIKGSMITGSTKLSSSTMFDYDTKFLVFRLCHIGEYEMFGLSKLSMFDGWKLRNLSLY